MFSSVHMEPKWWICELVLFSQSKTCSAIKSDSLTTDTNESIILSESNTYNFET